MKPRCPLEQLREKLPLLRRELQPQHIILFGSHARGEADGDSDVDVIFVADKFAQVKKPNRPRLVFAHVWQDRSVDAICLTPEEFEQKRRQVGIVATACEEGIWL